MSTQPDMTALLRNRFRADDWHTPFIDNFSTAAVTVMPDRVGLAALCTRTLSAWRAHVTTALADLRLAVAGEQPQPVVLGHTESFPWSVEQTGQASGLNVSATLFSPAYNRYTWIVRVANPGRAPVALRWSLGGALVPAGPGPLVEALSDGVWCVFRHGIHTDLRKADCVHDERTATWLLHAPGGAVVQTDAAAGTYRLDGREVVQIPAGGAHTFELLVEYAVTEHDQPAAPAPGAAQLPAWETALAARQRWWLEKLAPLARVDAAPERVLRAGALLLRCGAYWANENIVVSCSTVSDWPAMAFYWDELVAATGLMRLDENLALDALRGIYVRQRADGCTSASKYQFRDGSTAYPMAGLTTWVLVQMARRGTPVARMQPIIKAAERLHGWFVDTQDHDRDGLAEWRFTGCTADDTPLFDRYRAHSAAGLPIANFYLPPVASVSLNSYQIMDAKCLAWLHAQAGDDARAAHWRAAAARLETRLREVCLADGRFFFDYDQHIGVHNRALTLWSFLPLWAGVPVGEDVRRSMIEEVLLNPKHFFGPYPFPYVAYSDPTYKPDGYWRGRIWVHTTYWMLELLWYYGYQKEADAGADRLLALMDQREELYENYNSDPAHPGVGQADYNWSAATYLQLAERCYRRPVLGDVQ